MKKLNDIKNKTKEVGATSVLLSVLFDLNPSTVTNWNSNVTQPSLPLINEIADFLEVSNHDLILSKERPQTGLAKATQEEFKRLLDMGIPHKVSSIDKNGKEIKVNNPDLTNALRKFVAEYKNKTK